MQGAVLRILLRVVERCRREHSPGCGAAARLGAVAFSHRFGSALNAPVHFHCCIADGVFEPAGNNVAAGVVLHAAAMAALQARVRRRVRRAGGRRGRLDQSDAGEMGGWDHGGGFSVDASVRIEGADRAGLERLLRYCARPPFALEHLGEAIRPPRIAPARGPPLLEVAAAKPAGNDPAWDHTAPPAPAVEFDQRITLVRRNFCRALGTLG